jgi:hypothetical protein
MPSQDIYKDPDQNTEGLLAALVQQEVAEQEDAGEQLIGNDIWGMACQESREEAQLEGPASAASTSTTTTSSSSETNISDVTSTVLELLKDPSELAPALSSTSFEALPTHLKVLSVLGGGSSKEITPEALQWAARHPELMGHITASLTEAILSQIPPGPQDDNIDSDHLLNLGYTLSNALIALSSAAFNAFSCPAPLASARPAYTHKTGCAPSKWRYLQKILELQGLQRQLICMLREKDAELADIQEVRQRGIPTGCWGRHTTAAPLESGLWGGVGWGGKVPQRPMYCIMLQHSVGMFLYLPCSTCAHTTPQPLVYTEYHSVLNFPTCPTPALPPPAPPPGHARGLRPLPSPACRQQ